MHQQTPSDCVLHVPQGRINREYMKFIAKGNLKYVSMLEMADKPTILWTILT